MLRINDNIELYSNEKSLLAVRRGTGDSWEFEIGEQGRSLVSELAEIGAGTFPEPREENEALEVLRSLDIVTSAPPIEESHPWRTQWQCFRDWGVNPAEVQRKIDSARVAVVGVGGTGAWLALELAHVGVRDFLLIDPDHVEASNLVRQPFGRADVGRRKVDALADLLRDRGATSVEVLPTLLKEDQPLPSALWRREYIFLAADYPTRARAATFLSRACCERQKIHFVCGGYSGHASALGLTVIPGITPCWACYQAHVVNQLPPLLRPENLRAAGLRRTSGILPNVLVAASATALEFLYVMAGQAPQFSGVHCDLRPDWTLARNAFSARPDCPHCREVMRVR